MLRRRSLVVLSALLAAAAGILSLSGTAEAAESASIQNAAGRSANGAAVIVQLRFPCSGNTTYFLTGLTVTQRLPDGTVTGGDVGVGNVAISCHGVPQSVPLSVTARTKPFRLGPAFVSVLVGSDCIGGPCPYRKLTKTVSVQNLELDKSAYSSPHVSFSLPAQSVLQAGGAGTVVHVPYRCDAGFSATVIANLAQRNAGSVYLSPDAQELVCSGSHRSGVFAFHASGRAWHPGAAFLSLEGQICGENGCQAGSALAFRTLNLVNPD